MPRRPSEQRRHPTRPPTATRKAAAAAQPTRPPPPVASPRLSCPPPLRPGSYTTMDAVAREKAVYLAKLAEQAERYDGMFDTSTSPLTIRPSLGPPGNRCVPVCGRACDALAVLKHVAQPADRRAREAGASAHSSSCDRKLARLGEPFACRRYVATGRPLASASRHGGRALFGSAC